MKLLVSPTDEKDAIEAVKGGADIIDVKDPSAGSLGAASPGLIRLVKEAVGDSIPVSAAIGDVPNLPGTIAQAALGASMAGADFVKVGLYGTRSHDDARKLLESVVHALEEFNRDSIAVAALYADHARAGTINPLDLPRIAEGINVGVVMVDTAIKDGMNLFDFMSIEGVAKFVEVSREQNFQVALAGSLSGESFKKATLLGPDIVGVRTAALSGGNRDSGRVDSELVTRLKRTLKEAGRV
ncbi:MAG: (5-formylfuran-3-yl)methyl phosphate synthase [Candidatus Thorarchaeota archaeon]